MTKILHLDNMQLISITEKDYPLNQIVNYEFADSVE